MDSFNLKNIFQKPKLTTYLSDTVEISYSQYGPTIAISGTLIAKKKVMFIKNISLELFKKGSSDIHFFDWFAFRPNSNISANLKGSDIKMASKFTLSPSNPYHFNILFSDRNQYAETNPLFNNLISKWRQLKKKEKNNINKNNNYSVFKNFIQQESTAEIINKIKNQFYWKAGIYIIKINEFTSNPTSKISIKKEFFINDYACDDLKKNIYAIISDLSRQNESTYSIITPPLVDIQK